MSNSYINNANRCDNYISVAVALTLLLIMNKLIISVNCMDHCSKNRYQHSFNTNFMQFTKEVVGAEYAVLGQFKSLHCCAKGYRSIEWFKDGQPHPWGGDVSSLILYPEAANQTIYTRHVSMADVGNYTCVLRNDTHKTEHEIELKLQGNSPDKPLATFTPHDQSIKLGETARFYCEAFVGKLDLPDAKSHITWLQMFEGDVEQDVEGVQEVVTREDGQIVGSYLLIPDVKSHDYGRYLCRIETGNLANRLELSAWLFRSEIEQAEDSQFQLLALALAFIAAFLTVFIVYILKYGRSLWVQYVHANKNENRCAAQFRTSNDNV